MNSLMELYMFSWRCNAKRQKRRNELFKEFVRRRKALYERIKHLEATHMMLMNIYTQLPNYLINVYINAMGPQRSLWMKPRSNHFWSEVVLSKYSESDWLDSFRMCKGTFNDLCFLLQPALSPRPLFLKSREPLSVEKQVAVALYKLASYSEYSVVGNVFGIHKSTVRKCFYRVVNAINSIMMNDYLHMPNAAEAEELSVNFEKISNIPQIVGCIGATHIPILAPAEDYRDFVNHKGWPSYILQAVVDDKCIFRNIFIRHPGSSHVAAVFKDSSLYKNSLNIIPQGTKNVNGLEIPYFIIGDPAYPLLLWLLKGYADSTTPEQESFNVHLNSARVTVEMAFDRLKARWRILLKRIEICHTFVPNVVSASCILQNFLEYKKEPFIQQWLNDVAEADALFSQPQHIINQESEDLSESAIRLHLTEYLSNNYPLLSSALT